MDMEHWNTQRGARCPILETFKARLNEALSHLTWQKLPLLIAGSLD